MSKTLLQDTLDDSDSPELHSKSKGFKSVSAVQANEKLGLPFGRMRKITICFDVDGTLRNNSDDAKIKKPVANEDIRTLVRILRKFKNTKIIVWSGSGELYARQIANELHISQWVHDYWDKADQTNPTPDIAIDDIQDTAIGAINLIVREK